MARLVALTDRTEAMRWREVRDEEALWGDLRPELCAAVKTILEATMADELAAELLAGRYERTHVRLEAGHREALVWLGERLRSAFPAERPSGPHAGAPRAG